MKKYLLTALLVLATQSSVFAITEIGHGFSIVKTENGYVVNNVIDRSVAEQSGITNNQVVTKLNGKKIEKLKPADYSNLNTLNKKIKVTVDSTDITLVPENITLLNKYNNVQSTYNDLTKYRVTNYETKNVILPKSIKNKHVKYSNAYFNYADSIAISNAKTYVELFKVTEENVKKALDVPSDSDYKVLYNSLYSSQNNQYEVYGPAFKHFLELAIYNEQNQDLINRQISEFDMNERRRFVQMAYNTRICGNLYYSASSELTLFALRHAVNTNNAERWQTEMKKQNALQNNMYKDLLTLLSAHKIKINKPGPLSNREQVTAGSVPSSKWVDDKQIVVLAKANGYDPKVNPEAKAALADKSKTQSSNKSYDSWELAANNGSEVFLDVNSINVRGDSVYYNVKYFKKDRNEYVVATIQNKEGKAGIVSICTYSEYVKNRALASTSTTKTAPKLNPVTTTSNIYVANRRALELADD